MLMEPQTRHQLWEAVCCFGFGEVTCMYALSLCVITLPVSTHQSSVVLLLCLVLVLVLLHYAGKAAGVGGGAGKVLSLGDRRCPATHRQTTHLGHSDRTNACVFPYAEFIWAARSKCFFSVFFFIIIFPSKCLINSSASFHSISGSTYQRQQRVCIF